ASSRKDSITPVTTPEHSSELHCQVTCCGIFMACTRLAYEMFWKRILSQEPKTLVVAEAGRASRRGKGTTLIVPMSALFFAFRGGCSRRGICFSEFSRNA